MTIVYLSMSSLQCLSLVNTQFRHLCSPYLFRVLTITFSSAGLDHLEQASCSQIAHHVRVIRYRAAELVDPSKLLVVVCLLVNNHSLVVQHWGSFQALMYTPTEHVRDQREGCWNFSGREITYCSMHFYFSCQSREQQKILGENKDAQILCRTLLRFSSLTTFQLHFVSGVKPPFRWLAPHMFMDWKYSLPDHLEKTMQVMAWAKQQSIKICILQVSGFYSSIAPDDLELPHQIRNGLANVEDLHLIDSPSLIDFFSEVHLPQIQRLEVGSCWLSVADLEKFVHVHARTLETLHLKDTWLPVEKAHDQGISISKATTSTMLARLASIRECGILRELTIEDV